MTEQTKTAERLVLGTMNYGTTVDQDRAFEILDRFMEAGGVWLDTADCYSFWADPAGIGGASERVIGSWLAARPSIRQKVKIATKVRQNPLVPHQWPESAEGLSPEAIFAGVAHSLDRLGIPSIDLLWAHAEDRTVPLEETVAAFGELVVRGVVDRVGAANHPAWRVEQARSIARATGVAPWTAQQLRHSLIQPRPGAVLPDAGHRLLTPDDLDYARSEGLDMWCYTPLLNGGYVRADKPIPEAYDHPGTTRALEMLDQVCTETGGTRNQVVLAWLLQQDIHPIVGVSNASQLDEALDTARVTLRKEHMTRFAEAR